MKDIDDAIDSIAEDENPEEGPSEDAEGGGNDGESGFLDGIVPTMSGTGKSLDSYEDSPYRSLAGGAGGDVDADELRDKGEKHIARGIDGVLGGVVEAGHPLVDLAIGFFLVMLAGKGGGSGDSDEYGDESMSDTPGADRLETTGGD